jgi:hypothetical protein
MMAEELGFGLAGSFWNGWNLFPLIDEVYIPPLILACISKNRYMKDEEKKVPMVLLKYK